MLCRAQRGRTLRAIVAGAAAYALVLGVMLGSLLGAQMDAKAADQTEAGICLSQSADGTHPSSPAGHSHDRFQCVFCMTGAYAPTLPEQVFTTFSVAAIALAGLEPATERCLSSAALDPGKPPRGPPLTT
jgi:hypothetical protein